ncbi:MAG TPA: signal peptide peptidase SppA [Nitrospirota bacterium]|nr:signal peptide peptidase SppA [Nitrospirota bacterium]
MQGAKRIVLLAAFLPLLSGCFVIKVNLLPEAQPLEEQVISGEGRDKIALVDITGVITTEEGGTALGATKEPGMVAVLREQLDRARSDKNVKALVLRINSPGGGVTASDMLYHEIRKFRNETGVKVVAHFTDTGASGAYYTALAAERITAQPTTITGSIGVTMLRVDATGLMQKIGIQALEISSGPEKGMGSPFRAVTPEEKKIFQSMIDDLYGRFVGLIVAERKLAPERVRQLADGRIYTSSEAKDAGLIDGIGYLEDAFSQARNLAGIDRATIVTYLRPGEYRPNIYSLNMSLFNVNLGELAKPGMKFTYLWLP